MHDELTARREQSAYEIRTGRRWRAKRLSELGYASYADYLKGEHWQQLRAAYWADPETPDECYCCLGREGLQLHHKTYLRLGFELTQDLQPLCGPCHRDVHILADRGLIGYDTSGLDSKERRARYAEERRASLARRGQADVLPNDGRPYEAINHKREAQIRHEATKDPRAEARRLARQMRALK